MFCRFAFHYINCRCYIGVLGLAVYSLLGIRYYLFHLHHFCPRITSSGPRCPGQPTRRPTAATRYRTLPGEQAINGRVAAADACLSSPSPFKRPGTRRHYGQQCHVTPTKEPTPAQSEDKSTMERWKERRKR